MALALTYAAHRRATATATAALAAGVLALVGAGPAAAGRGMLVGVSDDALKWHTSEAIATGRQLDLQVFRITLPWRPRQTTLDVDDIGLLNDVTFRGGAAFRLVVSAYSSNPRDAPVSAPEREAYCAY